MSNDHSTSRHIGADSAYSVRRSPGPRRRARLVILALAFFSLGCVLTTNLPDLWRQGRLEATPTRLPDVPTPTLPTLPAITPDALEKLQSFRLRLVWSWKVRSPGTEGMRVNTQETLWLHEFRADIPARRFVFTPITSPTSDGITVPGATLPRAISRQWVQIGEFAWQCPGVLLPCDPLTQDSSGATVTTTPTPPGLELLLTAIPTASAPEQTPTFTEVLTSTNELTPTLPVSQIGWIDPQPGATWVGQPLLAGIEGLLSQLQVTDFRWLGVETVQGVRCHHLYTTSPLLARPLHPGAGQEVQDVQAHIWLADQPGLPVVVIRMLLTWSTQIGGTQGHGVFTYELLDLNAPIQIQPPVPPSE